MVGRDRSAYEEQLNAEIEKRIEQMERPDYQFPARFQKWAYLVWWLVVGFCLALLILGAYL